MAAAPVVVVFAFVVENTGWRDSAAEVLCVVFVEAEAAEVVPAPAWTEKVPLAAPLAAVAVVAVAAEATPANISAEAATAAKSICFIWFSQV